MQHYLEIFFILFGTKRKIKQQQQQQKDEKGHEVQIIHSSTLNNASPFYMKRNDTIVPLFLSTLQIVLSVVLLNSALPCQTIIAVAFTIAIAADGVMAMMLMFEVGDDDDEIFLKALF